MASAGRDDNPYAAPEAVSGIAATGAGMRIGVRWAVVWTLVFAGNLVVPLLFGWDMTEGAGRVGMALAVPLLWLAGLLGAGRSARCRPAAIAGGICVGLSQVFPLLHFATGVVSLGVTKQLLWGPPILGEVGGPRLASVSEGFLATLLTGGLLLVAAASCGLVAVTVLRAIGWMKAEEKAP
jgi:hypothetical protein